MTTTDVAVVVVKAQPTDTDGSVVRCCPPVSMHGLAPLKACSCRLSPWQIAGVPVPAFVSSINAPNAIDCSCVHCRPWRKGVSCCEHRRGDGVGLPRVSLGVVSNGPAAS